MKNWSPKKIWTNGMVDARNQHICHIGEIQNSTEIIGEDDLEWYGMDWSAPSPNDDGLSTVEVNDVDLIIDEDRLQVLHDSVNPLADSSSFGIDIYTKALDIAKANI